MSKRPEEKKPLIGLDFRRDGYGSPAWDLYSLAVVFLFVLLGALQWNVLPRSIDMYYHLSVVEGFRRAGGWTGDAFWEYAPVGRPHLYPPLLHFLLLGLRGLGLGVIDAGRTVDAALPPLVLASVWGFARHLYSRRTAFFAVLVWSSVYSLYLSAFIFPANSLAFAIALGTLALYHGRRYAAAAFAAALVFYAHGFMGWFTLLAALFYESFGRSRPGPPPRAAWASCAAAVLLAAPLLWHEASHRVFFSSFPVAEDDRWQFSAAVCALCVPGLWLAARRRGRYLFPICFAAGMSPLFYLHPGRFISGYGASPIVFLAAFALEKGYEKIPGRLFAPLAALFLILWNPAVDFRQASKKWSVEAPASTLVKGVYRPDRDDPRLATIYFDGPMKEISGLLARNSSPGDILWCNMSYAGAMIASTNGLATSTATLAEVSPYRTFDPFAAAKLLLWFKNPDGSAPGDMAAAVSRYGLNPAGETELAYLWINPKGGRERGPGHS